MTKHLRLLAPLLAAAAFAAGCGGGGSSTATTTAALKGYGAPAATNAPAQAPAPAGATVEMANMAFSPQRIHVKVGDTVTFVNYDAVAHTATATDQSFDSSTLEPGATFAFKATKAGKIPYVCNFHPGMTGIIDVTA